MEERKDMAPAGENTQEVVDQQEAKVQAGEQQPEAQQVEQEQPEFWLDEDGNLQGSFDDWAVGGQQEEVEIEQREPKKEEEEAVQETEPQEQKTSEYYTIEELAQLSPEEIDPNRLPPELRPFYDQMRTEQVVPPQEPPDEKQVLETLTEQAKKIVSQKFGEDFDELNPKHVAALAIEAQKLYQQYERQQLVRQKVAEIASREPYFQQIDAYAQQKLYEMPFKEAQRIVSAIETGDFDTVMKFWEQCRREFYENRLKQSSSQQAVPAQTQQTQQAKQPPRVEGAGRGEEKPVKRFDPRKLAEMDEDQQVQALIEMGLV